MCKLKRERLKTKAYAKENMYKKTEEMGFEPMVQIKDVRIRIACIFTNAPPYRTVRAPLNAHGS